ncbi:Uncharacterized protein FWK35_00021713, partial [Aphis craccivora]
LNLSTLSERRITSDIIFLNGFVSGIIDSPSLLSKIGFHMPGTIRSRDPYYIAQVTGYYLDDDPLKRAMSLINRQTSLSNLAFYFCYNILELTTNIILYSIY